MISSNKSTYTNAEFEGETFNGIDFTDLSFRDSKFTDCTFKNCNISNTDISNAHFLDIVFDTCKILGLNFSKCHMFSTGYAFINCQLKLCMFSNLKLKGTKFDSSCIYESDFIETDLTYASFEGCNLKGSIFQKTNLTKASFTNAYNYSIDPNTNTVKKARFSFPGVLGLLDWAEIEVV